jgi:hypothetical protein
LAREKAVQNHPVVLRALYHSFVDDYGACTIQLFNKNMCGIPSPLGKESPLRHNYYN